MGAMNTGEYASDSFIGQAHRSADPAIKEQIKHSSTAPKPWKSSNSRTIQITSMRCTPAALPARSSRSIQRWSNEPGFPALRNAVGARRDHERVLELNPNYVDAKLVVGAAQLRDGKPALEREDSGGTGGFKRNERKGPGIPARSSHSSGENSVDAKVVLALFLRASTATTNLATSCTNSPLAIPETICFRWKRPNLLRSGGHAPEAAAAYRKVWQSGREGKYGTLHYEISAWGLGELLRSQKDYRGAAAAYELVGEVAVPDPEPCRKPTSPPAKCMTCCSSAIWHEKISDRARGKCQHSSRGKGPRTHQGSLPGIKLVVPAVLPAIRAPKP